MGNPRQKYAICVQIFFYLLHIILKFGLIVARDQIISGNQAVFFFFFGWG